MWCFQAVHVITSWRKSYWEEFSSLDYITQWKIHLTLKYSQKKVVGFSFLFSTIDSTTAKPKLKLLNQMILICDQKVFECWSRKSIAWWMIACHLYLAIEKSQPLRQKLMRLECCTMFDQRSRLINDTKRFIPRINEFDSQHCVHLFRCGRQSNCLPALFTSRSRS